MLKQQQREMLHCIKINARISTCAYLFLQSGQWLPGAHPVRHHERPTHVPGHGRAGGLQPNHHVDKLWELRLSPQVAVSASLSHRALEL